MVPDPLPLAYAVDAFINVDNCERHSTIFIHIVSATALIRRTARSSIPAISSLLGLSPKCRQFVIMWARSQWPRRTHRFRSPGSPTDASLPGWQPVPNALGWPAVFFSSHIFGSMIFVCLFGSILNY